MTIYRVFEGLHRCAPGDEASLFRACNDLAPDAAILDAGCGNGADLPTLLAVVPNGRVTAVDLAPSCIASIRARYPRVQAEVANMTDPPGGPFDLIWSGGAIYRPGVAAALSAWRSSLAPGGRVVFTDLVLRSRTPSRDVTAFFTEDVAALRDVEGLRAEVEAAGWHCTDGFWLPDAAWDAYYGPLEQRLDALDLGSEPDMSELVAGLRREIALWRRHGDEYGYYLIVAVPR
jgi:SAM-dependent methyltransferase